MQLPAQTSVTACIIFPTYFPPPSSPVQLTYSYLYSFRSISAQIRLSFALCSLIINIYRFCKSYKIHYVIFIYYWMRQVQPEGEWKTVPQRSMALFKRMMRLPPPTRSSPPKITAPENLISEKHRQAEQKKIKNLPSIWILMAQTDSKSFISTFSKKIESIYRDTPILKNKCIIYPRTLHNLPFIFNKQLPVNIMICSNIFMDADWPKIRQELQKGKDYINQLYIKLEGLIEEDWQVRKEECEQKVNELGIQGIKIEIVKDFEEAEKKLNLYNFNISMDKSNFLNLSKVGIDEKETIGNFHHILLNTKSFLQESLQMKEKKEILSSYEKFRRFMQENGKNLLLQSPFKNQKIQIANNIIERLQQYITFYYDENQGEIQQSKRQEFYKEILQAYIKEIPIYPTVNGLCKTITNKETFDKIGFYCKFLYKAIHYFNQNTSQRFQQKNPNIKDLTLYRSTVFSVPELNEMRKSTGDLIVNLSFNSFSYSKQVACRFIQKKLPPNLKSTLLKIKFHPLFYKKFNDPMYEQYIQFFTDINLTGYDLEDEQQVLFNIFNIFKIISVTVQIIEDNSKIDVIELEYCGHIDLIAQREGGKIDPEDQKLLNNIMRFEKSKDAFEQSRDQGKKEEMLKVINQKIDGDVELKPDQTIALTESCLSVGNSKKIEELLEKIEKKQDQKGRIEASKQIIKAIFNSHLENNFKSIIELIKIEEEPEQKNQAKIEQKSLQEYFKMVQIKLHLISMQQKINSYEQCYSLISQAEKLLKNEIQVAICRKLLYVFLDYEEFTIQEEERPKRSPFFLKNKEKIEEMKKTKDHLLLKDLLETNNGQNEVLFLIQINEHMITKVFQTKLALERELQSYKNLFYQKRSFLLKIIQLQLDLRIKSQNNQDSSIENKNLGKSLKTFFTQSEQFFKLLQRAYDQQNSQSRRFEKALFFQHYSRFMNAKLKIISEHEQEIQQDTKQRQEKILKARLTLKQLNPAHNYFFNLDILQMSFLQEEVITQKRVKLQKMKSAVLKKEYSDIRISQEAIKLFKTSSEEVIKNYRLSNSNLSQNMIRNTLMSLIIERMGSQKQGVSREQLERELSQNMNQFEANIRGKPFLENHSTAALNNYLKAVYFFYKGCSEASNIFLQKSERIIKEKMNEGRKHIDENLKDQNKKNIMIKRMQHYSKTKDIIIKITLLKAKLYMHYKPKLYVNILSQIKEQINSIQMVMSRYHTTLLDLCSTYLGLLRHTESKKSSQRWSQQYQQLLYRSYSNNFKIAEDIAIFYKIDNTLQYFKLLYHYIGALLLLKSQNYRQYLQKFEKIAKDHQLPISLRGQKWPKDKIDYYMMYSLVKHQISSQNQKKIYMNDIWTCLNTKQKYDIPILNKELGLLSFVITFFNSSNNEKIEELLKMTRDLIDFYKIKIEKENKPSNKLGVSFILQDKNDYTDIVLYRDYKTALELALKISQTYYNRDPNFSRLTRSPAALLEIINTMKRQYPKLYEKQERSLTSPSRRQR